MRLIGCAKPMRKAPQVLLVVALCVVREAFLDLAVLEKREDMLRERIVTFSGRHRLHCIIRTIFMKRTNAGQATLLSGIVGVARTKGCHL